MVKQPAAWNLNSCFKTLVLSYSACFFKIRGGGGEGIPRVQDKVVSLKCKGC